MTVDEPRRGNSVTEDAIERIGELIASGSWRPGERLPRESDLATQLGLSRSSLREAVRALAMLRVLEVRQGDGTYVSSLSPDVLLESTRFVTDLLRDHTLVELYEVRRLLEPAAAALAAARITEAQLAELKRQLDLIQRAETVEALLDADAAFHTVITEAAGNTVLTALLGILSTRTMRARRMRGRAEESAFDSTRIEHVHIYRAIAARDPELARAAAAVHVATGEHWVATHHLPD